ncbi:MAG: hypothetical protein WC415_06340 [Patescibacteria group bacterium]|jgi:hypothetical protein
MEALWAALYARLNAPLDLWRGKAPPEYKGSPSGSPYVIGSLALSTPADDGGYMRIATLTLDGYAYGDETNLAALVEAMEDAHELIVTWRMQDTSNAGATSDWTLEDMQPVSDDDLADYRYRAVYTATYVSVRLCAAYNDPTIS